MGATKREQPTILTVSDPTDDEVIEFSDVTGAQTAPAGELLARWGLSKADVMQVVADLNFRDDFRTVMRIAAGHAVRGPGNVDLRRAFAKQEIRLPADPKGRAVILHHARLEEIGYDVDRANDVLTRACGRSRTSTSVRSTAFVSGRSTRSATLLRFALRRSRTATGSSTASRSTRHERDSVRSVRGTRIRPAPQCSFRRRREGEPPSGRCTPRRCRSEARPSRRETSGGGRPRGGGRGARPRAGT